MGGTGSEFGEDQESELRNMTSEHSGQHVSYLEEVHFRERTELARQMAALALASQVMYISTSWQPK